MVDLYPMPCDMHPLESDMKDIEVPLELAKLYSPLFMTTARRTEGDATSYQ
jgi:hypothetical protein